MTNPNHSQINGDLGPAPDQPSSARVRLLQCAADVFARLGYSGASVADIARQAEISKSTVFHHFASKRDLYLAVIDAAASDFAQTIDNLIESTGPFEERLSAFQCQHIGHIMENAQVTQLVLRELQKSDGQNNADLVGDVLSGNFQRLIKFIDRAKSEGLIKKGVDSSVAALTLISANVFFFQHQNALKDLPGFDYAQSFDEYARSVSQLIFHGLKRDSV